MGDIRIHKKLNLMPINFKKETLINIFYGLIKIFNRVNGPQDSIEVTKTELWKLGGFKGEYNSEYIKDLVGEITKADTFKISEEHEISGSIFVTERIGDKYKIYITEPYRKLLFTRKDLEIMTKAKNKEKMAVGELDYWDTTLKGKSKELVLLKEADILGINGKYNKRLYSLLGQFKKTGEYWTSMDNFKSLLEIPKSYKMGDIDKRILEPAKKELKEKAGIEISDIRKPKKGRKIYKIEIDFKILKASIPTAMKRPIKTTEEQPEEATEQIRGPESQDIKQHKEDILRLAEGQLPRPQFNIFKTTVGMLRTKDQINNLVMEFCINKTLGA